MSTTDNDSQYSVYEEAHWSQDSQASECNSQSTTSTLPYSQEPVEILFDNNEEQATLQHAVEFVEALSNVTPALVRRAAMHGPPLDEEEQMSPSLLCVECEAEEFALSQLQKQKSAEEDIGWHFNVTTEDFDMPTKDEGDFIVFEGKPNSPCDARCHNWIHEAIGMVHPSYGEYQLWEPVELKIRHGNHQHKFPKRLTVDKRVCIVTQRFMECKEILKEARDEFEAARTKYELALNTYSQSIDDYFAVENAMTYI